MQQVLIHVVPLFFALYAYVSLYSKTKAHPVIKGIVLVLILFSSQYPAFCRSHFMGYGHSVPHFGVVLYCWLFATQLLMIIFGFAKDVVAMLYRLKTRQTLPHPTTTGVSLTAAAMALAAWGSFAALTQPPVYELNIAIKNLPQAFDGFRIVQLSDIHASPLLDRNRLIEVVERTNALKPDMVVITGDIVDGKTDARLRDVEPLADLKAPYGVFGIEGNHEHYAAYEAWMQVLPTLKIDMLFNEHRIINKDGAVIALAGITDPMARRYDRAAPDVAKAIEGIDESVPIILLSHQVKYTRDHAQYPIALQLSGHTHGGQILGMHWLAQFLNKGFVRDYYRVGDLQLYVNRGTGLWYGFPIRLGISSEMTLVTLKASEP